MVIELERIRTKLDKQEPLKILPSGKVIDVEKIGEATILKPRRWI